MAAFFGSASHTLDPKGRATIPAAYREALGSDFTIGLNSNFTSIALYPKEEWDKLNHLLERIAYSDAKAMKYKRKITGNSFVGYELDGQGRVLLPAPLRDGVGISKNICFVGVGEFLEIWDEARYRNEMDISEEVNDELLDYVNNRYFATDR